NCVGYESYHFSVSSPSAAAIGRQLCQQQRHATGVTHTSIHHVSPYKTTEQQKPRGHHEPEYGPQKYQRPGDNLYLTRQAQGRTLALCRSIPGILPRLYPTTEIVDGRIPGVEQLLSRLRRTHAHNTVQDHFLPCLVRDPHRVKGGQRQQASSGDVLGGIFGRFTDVYENGLLALHPSF